MSEVFRSRFVYGTGGDWTTSLPTRPWIRTMPTVGGARTSAAGIPASHVVREDHNLGVPLRLYESEWSALIDLIRWGQLSETFVWYPDAGGSLIATGRTVYLEYPRAGDDLAIERDPEYLRVLETTLTLRKADATPWTFEYWPVT